MTHLLLIEDNDEIRENTAEILELAGYKVSSAANGKLGVEQALRDRPDLIICDIMMPVLDGYGVLHLLHRNPELTGIPFIFLTAKAERSDMRRGMEMGADDYITKPFTDIELLTAVESRIRKTVLLKKDYPSDDGGLRSMLQDFKGGKNTDSLTADKSPDTFLKKEIIYKEGNYPRSLFYIAKGKVKAFKTNEYGKELITGLFAEGDFFGYTAILEEAPYKETAEALDDCEVVVIPKEEFTGLIANSQQAAQKFIQLLARHVADKEEQLLGLAYNSMRKKVANALLTLQRKYHNDSGEQFEINLSREELANIAGTATESLIRTLSDFKAEHLVEIRNGNIIIRDEKKLENLIA